MTARDKGNHKGGSPARKPYRVLGAAVLIATVAVVVIWLKVVQGGEDPANALATFPARRGPLTISVLEAGALRAKDPTIVRSALPRRATIISIVPEGTWVRAGDLLVELDVAELVDHLVDHEIMMKNSEAYLINAQEALTIQKSWAQSQVELAELKYRFAQLDLEKYQGSGGQLATDLAESEGRIKLAEEEVKKNEDYYDWSKRLADEKYLSQTQLQTDQLSLEKSKLSLTVAQNSRNLLKEYNSRRQLAQLTSDVNQAAMELERAKARARANIAQVEANLSAREQEHRNQVERLERHRQEAAQGKIYAPTDGMVIYATSSRGSSYHDDRRPLADGVEVWERQELIYLPKTTSTVAEVDLHEANLQKVCLGLPVIVTVDALPGTKLMGTVTRIAPLPDPQSMWMNPDLKVYKTEIALDSNDAALRSGMNCRAEIIIEHYADAVYVPVQTLRRVDGQPTLYVLNDSRTVEERQVEIGLDDNKMIHITGGLKEGELVLLTPGSKAGPAEPGARFAALRGTTDDAMREQIHAKLRAAQEPVPPSRAADPSENKPAPALASPGGQGGSAPTGEVGVSAH
ncbi:MAG: efflux transporter periplasmic adaptor subunit [Planctomycetes bacterium]|jgi:HlyD family secretion protein|nr:efflux transporter periplasmic adaptor subunit [Planctomycetota bacterium]